MTKYNRTEISLHQKSAETNRLAIYDFCNSLKLAITDLQQASELDGDSWQSAKSYYELYDTVLQSLRHSQIDFAEAYGEFVGSFEAEVGGTENLLDSDKLLELQNQLQQLEREKDDLIVQMSGNMFMELSFGGWMLQWKNSSMNRIQKKVDILEKYVAFEAAHASDFTEVLSALTLVQSAMSELGSGNFNSQTGQYEFDVAKYKNSQSYKDLTDYNASKPESRADIILETVYDPKTKMYKNVYNVYINGEHNETATANLFKLMEENKTEMVKHMAGEIFLVYDIYRLMNGKDPVTGDKASRLEASAWLLLAVLPFDEFMKMSKTFSAGNKLLKGADLTADQLHLLNKAGFFDEAAKLPHGGKKVSGADVTSKYDDLYTYKYNGYDNLGPLNEVRGQPNKNFYGGRYNMEVLKEPKVYYRGGDSTSPLGQWFTETPPSSVADVRINSAVKPQWLDKNGALTGTSTIDTVYKVEIPAGTTIYKGPVGNQGGIYQGGLNNNQVFIQEPWLLDKVNIIEKQPLK